MSGHWQCKACGWSPEPPARRLEDLCSPKDGGWYLICARCGGAVYQWHPDGDLVVVEGEVFNAMDYPGLTPEERIRAAINAAAVGREGGTA